MADALKPGPKFGGRFAVRRQPSRARDVTAPRTTMTMANEMAASRVGAPASPKAEG